MKEICSAASSSVSRFCWSVVLAGYGRLEELAVEIVHLPVILHLPQINGAEDNVGEIHVDLFQTVQEISHGLPQLQIEERRDHALAGMNPSLAER
jgi:hypothetical protein